MARLSARSESIDFNTKHETSYCIPLWLRDEQIKIAITKCKDRIEEYTGVRDEPIAVVGFGPSLLTTWEKLKEFKYIITCSGAHRFLIERGIIPTWHVEVDPREHKIKLLGKPHPDVTYLPASTCHPKYFDHLAGYKVKLWHVFSNEEDAIRTLPRDEWALFGGPDVGMRAMAIARFFGFRELHVFGIDGCAGPESITHATEHPNGPSHYMPTEYQGRTFRVTASLLECAKAMWHELDMLKDVTPIFYGDGLVQHMAKFYERKPAKSDMLGLVRPALISVEYRDLNKQLHLDNLAYGVGGGKYAPVVRKFCESLQTRSVLDYGCGKGYLAKALDFPIWEYDPAIPGKEELPRPADLVICTDVLEHIERDKLLFVLDDLRRCVKKVGYFVIHTGPSSKLLADGRNAHLIQEGRQWWKNRIKAFFKVVQIYDRPPLLHFVVEPQIIAISEEKKVA